jgi:hypothetical protein
VPVSLSSALSATYFTGSLCGIKLHFKPVGKPAPPRPRRFDAFTTSITSDGFILRAFFSPS